MQVRLISSYSFQRSSFGAAAVLFLMFGFDPWLEPTGLTRVIDASQSDLAFVFLIEQYVALQPNSFGGFIERLEGQNITRRMRRPTEQFICAINSSLSAKEQIKNFRVDHVF